MSFEGLQVKTLTANFSSIASDAHVALRVPNDAKIVSAYVTSYAGLAASDTDYLKITVTNLGAAGSGSTVIAEIDTRAAHENALVAKVAETMNLSATAANLKVAAGDVLDVFVDAGGTIAGDASVVLGYTFR